MRAGTLISFVGRTRGSQRLTIGVIVAHLWWLSKGRCSQSQYKQRLCLKWHELDWGNEWGLDLSLALHENSCTWESWHLTSANGYTCIWQNQPRRCTYLDLFLPFILFYLPMKTLKIIFWCCIWHAYFYPLNKITHFDIFMFSVPFVSWEITRKWHKWLTAMY